MVERMVQFSVVNPTVVLMPPGAEVWGGSASGIQYRLEKIKHFFWTRHPGPVTYLWRSRADPEGGGSFLGP